MSLGLIFITVLLTACGTTVVTGHDATMSSADANEVTGHCELILPDGRTAGCDDVTLFLRAPDDGEERRASFSGDSFTFRDLNRRSYVLNAASSKYVLETNVKNEVTPGQMLKIRIRANSR